MMAISKSNGMRKSLVIARTAGLLLLVAVLISTTAGCDSSSGSEIEAAKVQVRLELEGLSPLVDGFHYQAWAKVGFEFIPSPSFNVNESGSFTNTAGQLIQSSFIFPVDISDATEVFITIEDKKDSDEFPSDTVVLAGDVVGSTVTLSQSHTRSLGRDFSGENGSFMLFTESDDPAGNETSGLWFTTGSAGNLSAGLSLPSLPDGWIYEGWVDTGSAVLSTGQFSTNAGHDSARPFSLPDVPAFPGEDFLVDPPAGITFPLDLSGAAVSVTVEPFPDDTADSYGIRILSGTVPAPAVAATVYSLGPDFTGPTGTATIF